MLRFFATEPREERLLLVNLGKDLPVTSLADPLLAPPVDSQWSVIWSSEDLAYGGGGKRAIDFQKRWTLGADTALLLAPTEAERCTIPDRERLFTWQAEISNI